MKNQLKRREFILKTCQAGMAGCALLYGSPLIAAGNLNAGSGDEKPDPKKLNYCGYICPPECKMKKATLENNTELKKEAYKEWRVEEKYGIAFDPEVIVCYGCKVEDEKVGLLVKKCSVRNCAIEKGYDCCIQCDQLTACDKELWKNFPDFHKMVIEMQKNFAV
jgi:hypothetical protein